MNIQDSIEAIEQQIYVACSDGDYDKVTVLEHKLEHLRSLSSKDLSELLYGEDAPNYFSDDF